MALTLTDYVHIKTDQRFIGYRLTDSVYRIAKKNGLKSTVLMITGMTLSQFTAFAVSYFCIAGSIRSLKSIAKDKRPIANLTPLGNAGGWCAIAVFTAVFMRKVFQQLIAEGEYEKALIVSEKYNFDLEDGLSIKAYSEMYQILDSYSLKSFYSHTLFANRLKAMNILKSKNIIMLNKKYEIDLKMQKIYSRIEARISEETSGLKMIQRLYGGLKVCRGKGLGTLSIAVIFSVVLPVFLFGFASLTVAGEVGLGKELFVNKESLDELGHFGEWVINFIEIIGTIIFTGSEVLSLADFKIKRKIFKEELNKLEHKPKKHEALRKLANKELVHAANTNYLVSFPKDYKFTRLNQI